MVISRKFQESCLFFLILFTPQASFAIFYAVIIPFSLILAFPLRKSSPNFSLILMIGALLIVYIGTKSIAYGNLYDFKELMKVVLFLLVYSSFRRINLYHLELILFMYITIDCSVSLLQFLHVDIYFADLISSIYNTEAHAKASLQQSSVRGLGLSPGPGQHGAISLLIFWFYCTLYFFDGKNTIRFIGVILALSSLLMSQSKTSLIALLASIFIFLIILFVNKNNYFRLLGAISILIAGFLIWPYIEDIKRIFYGIEVMIESGLNTSSLNARFELWGGGD